MVGRLHVGGKFLRHCCGGCTKNVRCGVDFGSEFSVCSRAGENLGKLRPVWPVAAPSGCIMTSSQQSGLQAYAPWRQSVHAQSLCQKKKKVQMCFIKLVVPVPLKEP
jgi:hypothetical protein